MTVVAAVGINDRLMVELEEPYLLYLKREWMGEIRSYIDRGVLKGLKEEYM